MPLGGDAGRGGHCSHRRDAGNGEQDAHGADEPCEQCGHRGAGVDKLQSQTRSSQCRHVCWAVRKPQIWLTRQVQWRGMNGERHERGNNQKHVEREAWEGASPGLSSAPVLATDHCRTQETVRLRMRWQHRRHVHANSCSETSLSARARRLRTAKFVLPRQSIRRR